jgi:hypothetical protein|tara:strand:- start:461 stop:832 length:372 start_codon:yes stop_codon:yes gene_type:complete
MRKLIKKINYFVYKLKQNYIKRNNLCNCLSYRELCWCKNVKTPFNKIYKLTKLLVKLSYAQFIKVFKEIYNDELNIYNNVKELKYLYREEDVYNLYTLYNYWNTLRNERIQSNNEFLDCRSRF